MKVALFVTCLIEAFAPHIAPAAARLVAASGADLEVVPVGDACCGQPAWNAGYPAEARALARRLLPRLAAYAAVVVPSGSCATMLLRYYPHLFHPDDPMAQTATAVASRTHELTAYLAAHGLPAPDAGGSPQAPAAGDAGMPAGGPARAVAFHPSCHSLRGAGVGDAGERCLIRSGCALRPHADREECCGFGGLFAIKEPALSAALADRKCDALLASGASFVAAGELGCLLHLEGRARRRGLPLRFGHIAEVLAGREADD